MDAAVALAAARVLDDEVAATRFRLRAVQDRWMPRLEAAATTLDLALAEAEGAEAVRLRLAVSRREGGPGGARPTRSGGRPGRVVAVTTPVGGAGAPALGTSPTRILLAVRDSASSLRAARLAIGVAVAAGCPVLAVTAVRDGALELALAHATRDPTGGQRHREAAAPILRHVLTLARAAGVEAEGRASSGPSPAPASSRPPVTGAPTSSSSAAGRCPTPGTATSATSRCTCWSSPTSPSSSCPERGRAHRAQTR